MLTDVIGPHYNTPLSASVPVLAELIPDQDALFVAVRANSSHENQLNAWRPLGLAAVAKIQERMSLFTCGVV